MLNEKVAYKISDYFTNIPRINEKCVSANMLNHNSRDETKIYVHIQQFLI
jgi:hypothetical protein